MSDCMNRRCPNVAEIERLTARIAELEAKIERVNALEHLSGRYGGKWVPLELLQEALENNDSKRTRYICCKNCNEGKPCYWRNNSDV